MRRRSATFVVVDRPPRCSYTFVPCALNRSLPRRKDGRAAPPGYRVRGTNPSGPDSGPAPLGREQSQPLPVELGKASQHVDRGCNWWRSVLIGCWHIGRSLTIHPATAVVHSAAPASYGDYSRLPPERALAIMTMIT